MQFIASAAIFGFRLGCENGGHQLEKRDSRSGVLSAALSAGENIFSTSSRQ